MPRVTDQVETLIEPALSAMGYELLGVEYIAQGKHSLLRAYIDKEEGVDVDDCAEASRQISAILDVEEPISDAYTLEVSSPGIERPLFKKAHFQLVEGEQIFLKLYTGLDGRRKFKGKLLAVEENTLTIQVDGVEYKLELEDIDKANLVADWS